ncbi:MAG: YceI family protein [Flavobacteriales bacterium]|nr:YceI family protein [Flavobacteriia bacterium]NCP05280.1 YceI family protein [Flavobacteriales bacterium]PIV95079.1 MAG: YceI family protein [Flavobacteriaceae bacterium CG17_big_fil_post_rev_8_21_14_2_50_33_15]PIY09303.1 MAG: YceI family protein [Flavobacteriaceae bacterium CG_4_10_14_3_um_filter_33_47]PJB20277.1 MAG: YceI family protein [Flavobacteriaceae bacterium CG_4_9_14_3_um_filter_33_16]
MKKTIKNLAIVALVAFTTFSFTRLDREKKDIKVEDSQLVWKGYKVTGSHEGTIAIKSGSLEFNEDVLVGGEFVVDMTTLASTDLEGEYKGKLEGHLKSDDFFGVENHPTATLVFSDVKATGKNSYSVTGNLTVKGKTNPITFSISIYGSKATATLKVDRTAYDVKYGSASFFDGLKDKAIYDEFDLVADLVF